MNLLKPSQSHARDVRQFDFRRPDRGALVFPESANLAPPSTSETLLTATQDDRQALVRRIAELEKSLEALSARVAEERDKAFEEGKTQGRAEAEKFEAERLALLEDAMVKAQEDANALFEKQTDLAVTLTRATLARILGDKTLYAEMILDVATSWKKRLARSSITRLSVSAADFADSKALENLKQAIGAIELNVDTDLEAGACLFDLQLGSLDASLPLQAAAADRLLGSHIKGGEGAA